MKFIPKSVALSAVLCVTLSVASLPCAAAQARPAAKPKSDAADTPMPQFSGTWILNTKRSQLIQRATGESRAIIQYDGKTWHYIHTHQSEDEDKPDEWQTTMEVGSAKMHTSTGDDITFQSRMVREGSALVMQETGVTANGQHVRNTVRYTLQDNGNTLVETETSVGPLGPQKNIYVLEREGTRPADNPMGPQG